MANSETVTIMDALRTDIRAKVESTDQMTNLTHRNMTLTALGKFSLQSFKAAPCTNQTRTKLEEEEKNNLHDNRGTLDIYIYIK